MTTTHAGALLLLAVYEKLKENANDVFGAALQVAVAVGANGEATHAAERAVAASHRVGLV